MSKSKELTIYQKQLDILTEQMKKEVEYKIALKFIESVIDEEVKKIQEEPDA